MRDGVRYRRTARCGEQTESCIKTSKNKRCPRKAFLPSFTGRVTHQGLGATHTAEKVAVFGLSQGEVIPLNTLGTQPTSQKGGCLRSKCHTGRVTAHPGTERDFHRNTVTRGHLMRGQQETLTPLLGGRGGRRPLPHITHRSYIKSSLSGWICEETVKCDICQESGKQEQAER